MSFQPVPVAPRNNIMASISLISALSGWGIAIFSLILGALTFGAGALCIYLAPIPWLVAVITGHVARKQIKQTGESGEGQAKVGMITGYASLALIVGGFFLCTILVFIFNIYASYGT